MNIETPISTRPGRGSRGLAALVVGGVLALSVAGCQSTLPEDPAPAPTGVAFRSAGEARPAGLGPHATADQIERAIADRRALLSERYAGQPADRIAEQLERDRDASRGFLNGCVSYRLVEHPSGGWHVVCVQQG